MHWSAVLGLEGEMMSFQRIALTLNASPRARKSALATLDSFIFVAILERLDLSVVGAGAGGGGVNIGAS